MKHILKSVRAEYTRTQNAVENAIREKAVKEAVASASFHQRRIEVKRQIDRVRDVIQNKQPSDR